MTEIYSKLTSFFGLPADSEKDHWSVLDTAKESEIVLLHYNSEKIKDLVHNHSKYTEEEFRSILALKGVIVDIECMRTIIKSFGYTPTLYHDVLPDGVVDTEDENSYMEVDFATAVFQPFYEGTLARLAKHKGEYFLSSQKKIITTNSRWGSSKTFEEMFLKFWGKKTLKEVGDIVFDKTKESSNFCHIFLISHPDLLISTKMNIGAGCLKYLRHEILKNNETDENVEVVSNWLATYPFKRIDGSGPDVPVNPITKEGDTDIYMPVNFGREVANKILKDGYIPGSGCGEPVVCIYDNFRRICKITPSSGKWRSNIIGNNPNYYNRYVRLLDYAYEGRKIQYEEGEQHFTYEELFNCESTVDIKSSINSDNDKSVETKIEHITKCFQAAVPLHVLEEAKGFYARYQQDYLLLKEYIKANIEMLIENIRSDKLKTIKQFRNNGKLNPAGKALTRIVTQALKYTSKQKNVKGYTALLQSIDVLLSKEYGGSLYSLMRVPSKASVDVSKISDNVAPVTILKKVLKIEKVKPLSNLIISTKEEIDEMNTDMPKIVAEEREFASKLSSKIAESKQVKMMRKKIENMRKKLVITEAKLLEKEVDDYIVEYDVEESV
jgi:hypothetical protein